MRVIYGIGGLKANPWHRAAVAIGVFDGVHRGHQMILRRLVRDARRRGWQSVVVTFSLHPSWVVNPSLKILHLTSLPHKLDLLKKAGVDLCCVIDFNRAFAGMDAERFIRQVLVKKIGVAALYVGEDFVFGRLAKGNQRALVSWAKVYGFELMILRHLEVGGRLISSTLIRALVRRGRLDEARRFLGRPVSLSGEVIHGEGRGRSLGFPTANIRPHHEVIAPDGVYAARVVVGRRLMPGIAYIGTKPTFHRRPRSRSIEVFIFRSGLRLYGRSIEIRFLRRIRSDRKFSTRAALIAQIQKDIICVRRILA